MRLRLAGGVVAAPDQAAWLPAPRSPARVAAEGDARPGAAVALGPADAGGEQVRAAVTGLRRLVEAGGEVAAGAGVDLGGGFRSARLAGARGDQRDAVLAALTVLGVEGAGRLGDRAGFLVALFGPAVTRRVGAAAARAISEGRWAAVHLASAASDLLGPEQLERILELEAPGDAGLFTGARPSVLAANLGRVLEPLPRPRRAALLLDLWERVAGRHAWQARREGLLATQARRSRLDDLRDRHDRHEDDLLLRLLRTDLGSDDPPLAAAARWIPPDHYWYGLLNRLLQDALAATALLHAAVEVHDHGPEEGLARASAIIGAADAELPDGAAADAARYVPGLTGLPARPGVHIRDLHRVLTGAGTGRSRETTAAAVRRHLAHARDHAALAIERIGWLLNGREDVPEHVLREWTSSDLRPWRERTGHGPAGPPEGWAGLSWWSDRLGTAGPQDTRAAEAAEAAETDAPAEVERAGELLWCVDLVNALARLHGHDAAEPERRVGTPWLDHDPPLGDDEPLAPRFGSLAGAVSGAAQLAELGGVPARGARTWTELVESLRAGTRIAEALSGEFAVPAPLAALDGTVVPGTGARFVVARSARVLAEWSEYMGNCIAGAHYVGDATAGRCVLAALCDGEGRVLVNVELVPARPARGWRINEIAGRFNESPDPRLARPLRGWVATIPQTEADDDPDLEPPAPEEVPPSRTARRPARPRPLQAAGPVLERLAEREWNARVRGETAAVLTALAGTRSGPGGGSGSGSASRRGVHRPGAADPAAAVTRLRRLGPLQLAGACRNALAQGPVDLVDLWALTEVRPLEAAIAALDPALPTRYAQLTRLTGAEPPPPSLRPLTRLPRVAPSYSMGVVARRMRAAVGRLALDGDPVLARALTRRPAVPPLCALAVLVTCRAPALALAPVAPPRAVSVPGFPATALNDPDGPWQRALPAARELGADTSVFWERIAADGLRVPAEWLAAGGWGRLWSRAHAAGRT
ncbi:hypothetical protein GCM10023085_44170 [Actinomadura viridis]|uniref:Uncharacterized protein n=1 Tax=Actinomadura viridis TaxID=58110 RepID=A0A931GRJ6_9ACTN|nr:hypothetical protein [Actinomadura viridis]MBG6089779.1 hypothetical protein [Actinomadura viridis]